jgi:hypothetical protein
VVIARGIHPFSFRTRPLSLSASTILLTGKIERCQTSFLSRSSFGKAGFFWHRRIFPVKSIVDAWRLHLCHLGWLAPLGPPFVSAGVGWLVAWACDVGLGFGCLAVDAWLRVLVAGSFWGAAPCPQEGLVGCWPDVVSALLGRRAQPSMPLTVVCGSLLWLHRRVWLRERRALARPPAALSKVRVTSSFVA